MTQSQRYSQSQSRPSSQFGDAEFEGDLLLAKISKTKGLLLPMTRKFFENNLNFSTPFDDETKATLKEHMLEFLTLENQLKMQQEASTRLQYESKDLSHNFPSDEPIESILEGANLSEKFEQVLNEIKQASTFNPIEDDQYKNLLNLLEDDKRDETDELEVVDRGFAIPQDPFSKMEIMNPVRNKNCNHLYEKEQFFARFETRNGFIKCPYTGCANKKVTINDVEDDARTKILIDNAKRQQS